MALRILQVDAFSDRPFAGNPAAVCILRGPADPAWMQNVAREMNLSETAFLHPEGDGYSLRWFTPAVEVDLCGHATLAAAHVLWEEGHLAGDSQARFQTKSGLLTADRRGDWIELDFPATGPATAPPPAGLIEALGVAPSYVGKTRFDYLLEVASEAAVPAVQPHFGAPHGVEARRIIVTAPASTSGLDFVPRQGPPPCACCSGASDPRPGPRASRATCWAGVRTPPAPCAPPAACSPKPPASTIGCPPGTTCCSSAGCTVSPTTS